MLRPAGKGSGVTYFAVSALSILSVVFCAFLGERIALFSEHPTSFMNVAEFYATFAFALSMVVAALFLIHRNFRIGISWPWLFLFLILGVGNAIGTFAFGTHFSGETIYHDVVYHYDLTFTLEGRFQYVLCFFLACVHFYLFFAVFPKIFPHTRWLRMFCWFGVIMAIAAITYSLIAEWDLYCALFDSTKKIEGTWMMSFTNNENTFAYLILAGICASCILHNGKSRFYYWLLILGLGLFQIFVLSATGVVCSWLLILGYGIYRYVLNVKHKPVRSTMTLLLLIGGVIAIVVLLFTDPFGPGSFLAKLHAEIGSYFGVKGKTFSTRVATWNIILDTLSSTNMGWAFGIGDFQSRMYLAARHVPIMDGLTIYSAHSAVMQTLVDGGLLSLAVHLIVLGRFFYVVIKRMSAHSRIAFTSLLCFLILLLHGTMEAPQFLSMDAKGTSILLLTVLPLEVEAFHAKHPKLKGYLEACKVNAKKTSFSYEYSPLRFAKVSLLFLTLFLVLGVGVGAVASNLGYFGQGWDWSVYGLFIGIWFFAPLGYLGIGTLVKRKAACFWLTVFLFAYVGLGIGFSWQSAMVGRIAFVASIVTCLIPFVFRAKTALNYLPSTLKTAYLPHFFIGGALLGGTLLALLIPAQLGSLQIVVSLSLSILFLYPCLIALPKKLRLGYPLFDKLMHLDLRILAKSLLREEKIERKQAHHFNPRYQPPREKRIYVTRPW